MPTGSVSPRLPSSPSACTTGSRSTPESTPLTLQQACVSRDPIAIHARVNKDVRLSINPRWLNDHCKGKTPEERAWIAHALAALQTGDIKEPNYGHDDRMGDFQFKVPVDGADHVIYTHDRNKQLCHIAVKGRAA